MTAELHAVHRAAGNLADLAVSMLSGVSEAAVMVAHGYAYDYPLAIRTPRNDGFGDQSLDYFLSQKILLRTARLQAKYALHAGGKDAGDQRQRLLDTYRDSPSYGCEFPPHFVPSYAVDRHTGLALVVASGGMTARESTAVAERAVHDAQADKTPEKVLPAAELLYAVMANLVLQLPAGRVGVAMLASPQIDFDLLQVDPFPLVLASQTAGDNLSPANFDLVAAKARSVALTGFASGPSSSNIDELGSEIPGAIPVRVPDLGDRILAAGGLPDGLSDVEVLKQTLISGLPHLGITLLRHLTRG